MPRCVVRSGLLRRCVESRGKVADVQVEEARELVRAFIHESQIDIAPDAKWTESRFQDGWALTSVVAFIARRTTFLFSILGKFTMTSGLSTRVFTRRSTPISAMMWS